MNYYVLHASGQRFGPADLQLLNQWVAEGRITPTTQIQEETTGQILVASQVPGLQLGQPGFSQPTGFSQPPGTYQGYYRGPGPVAVDSNNSTIVWSYILSFGSLCLCLCGACGAPAIIGPIIGLVLANQAQQRGSPNANGARICAMVMIGFWALLDIAFFGFFAIGMSGR